MRAALRERAAAHRLCWVRLRLEHRGSGPCFARQLRRCNGVCVGAEAPEEHDARLCEALAPLAIPGWPLDGPAMIRERSSQRERTDVHVIRDWCWLGTARDDGELGRLIEAPQRPEFDLDVTRLLLRRYAAGALALLPVGRAADPCIERAPPDPFERRESMSN
jgi:DNA polymerase-3 subunit epsilon